PLWRPLGPRPGSGCSSRLWGSLGLASPGGGIDADAPPSHTPRRRCVRWSTLMSLTEGLADQLRWTAFDRLRAGRPAPVTDLAGALRIDPSTAEAAVGDLAVRGVLERDSTGAVVGAHGLTLVTTRHRLVVDGVELYTWCALDAIGIP